MPVASIRSGGASLGIVRQLNNERLHECAINDFAPELDRAHLCFEKKESQLVASLQRRDFVSSVAEPLASSSNRVTGRERMTQLQWCLNSMGIERSAMQKGFHLDMIGACARLIFKDDLEANLDDLLTELGITELRSEFMAITPRRTGKTYSVAMFVVAFLYSVENSTQSIFSTGRRASQKLIELIYKLACKIPGLKESIIKHNVETIEFRGPCGDGDVRKVSSYPSNPKISAFSSLCLFSFVFLATSVVCPRAAATAAAAAAAAAVAAASIRPKEREGVSVYKKVRSQVSASSAARSRSSAA